MTTNGHVVPRAPLILTLAFETQAFLYFNNLRKAHFPLERNFIPAHVTLFHRLPGEQQARIGRQLVQVAARTTRFPLMAERLWMMGRGVSFRLNSPPLLTLREQFARQWQDWLSLQDQAPYVPHITVQNKVTVKEARSLHAMLSETFTPFSFQATGMLLWRYDGGPWTKLGEVPFAEI